MHAGPANREALGPFPPELLQAAKDTRLRRMAEGAEGSAPQLGARLGLAGARPESPEARCLDLLARMLAPWPGHRISAAEALRHPFVALEEPPLPARPPAAATKRLATGCR